MTKRMLPIGMQKFSELRERDCYYVDKTLFAAQMVDDGKHYFLSRPRRFGKSLFLDTLKELFEAKESLFEGLAIHNAWDWSVRHAVIRLSFGGGNFAVLGGLEARLMDQLARIERNVGLDTGATTAAGRLDSILEVLHERTGRGVVVLVDEYDKPILDALSLPDVAKANRDFLRGVYAVIKDRDADVRFSFVTGVSKFSKVSLFSGLNDLTDITLDPCYTAICGYTEADLDAVFSPELVGLDRDEIRDWYNGYCWTGDERIYNPFDILLLFRTREFKAHWFETGSPTFLIDTLFERRVTSLVLEDMIGTEELLSKFDVGDISTEALLFQTGYLTIRSTEDVGGEAVYRLGFPNREVRQSLNRSLLGHLVRDRTRQTANSVRLFRLLEANDFSALEALFQAFFASNPVRVVHQQRHRGVRRLLRERVLFLLCGLGFDITVEDSSSHGRLDMAVRFNDQVYLLEFKVVGMSGEGAAMAQLKEKRYADKYRSMGQPHTSDRRRVRQGRAQRGRFRGGAGMSRVPSTRAGVSASAPS